MNKLVLLMHLSFITGILLLNTVFAETTLLGDVNQDGEVCIIDALMIAKYTNDLNPQPFNPDNASVNCDGVIDISDAYMVAEHYVGIRNYFPKDLGCWDQGEFWIDQNDLTTKTEIGQTISTIVNVNTNSARLKEFELELTFDTDKMTVNPNEGVVSLNPNLSIEYSVSGNVCTVVGASPAGIDPSLFLELFTVNWQVTSLGASNVYIHITKLNDMAGSPIIPGFNSQNGADFGPFVLSTLHISNPLGNIWIEAEELDVIASVGDEITTVLRVNTGDQRLGAYGIKFKYDNTKVRIPTMNGIRPGEDGFTSTMNIQNEKSEAMVAGLNLTGADASSNLQLLEIDWRILDGGQTEIEIEIESMVDNSMPPDNINYTDKVITIVLRATIIPPPPTLSMKLQYDCPQKNSETMAIQNKFRIVNTSYLQADLSKCKAYYFYTKEGGENEYTTVATATPGTQNVICSFESDVYKDLDAMVVGFTENAGVLLPGASAECDIFFHKSSFNNYDQSNDPSWDPSYDGYGDFAGMCLYYDGQLMWGSYPKIDKETTSDGEIDFNLCQVPLGSYLLGLDPDEDVVYLNRSIYMSQTEVTYALWHKVYQWAIVRTPESYNFANPGREGNDGTIGAVPGVNKNMPVTTISWKDCILWCNALSEYQGLKPVYYTDESFENPIRSHTMFPVQEYYEHPYVDWYANGYRIPTEAEWDIAARGAKTALAIGSFNNDLAHNPFNFNGIDDIAWYNGNCSGTRETGTKAFNELYLYDINGNVAEFCYDLTSIYYPVAGPNPSAGTKEMRRNTSGADAQYYVEDFGPNRTYRGGSFSDSEIDISISTRQSIEASAVSPSIGFRFVTIDIPVPQQTVVVKEATGGETDVAFNLRLVPAGSYNLMADEATIVDIANSYWIGETEVTYKVWYEVYQWATEVNGQYNFANNGKEGTLGDVGAPPDVSRNLPVQGLSWRDCILFCNALSEMQNLTPVYYVDANFSTPLRTSVPGVIPTAVLDYPFVNWEANGYRLPTEAEWEIAARGGKIAKEAGMFDLPMAGTGRVESYFNIGWNTFNSNGVSHDVALKQGNELGLFDMNGNLQEFCWDWYDNLNFYPSDTIDPRGPSGPSSTYHKVTHGGNYHYCMAPFKGDEERMPHPPDDINSTGFRMIRIEQ